MLDMAILGLLVEQDLHGYELKKRLSDMLGFASGVSFGSLYPALGRLERSGAVRSLGLEPAAGRVGARVGRSRKVYSITHEGRACFRELLAEDGRTGDDGRGFALRLAFARYLDPDERIELLERRRASLMDRRSRLRSRLLEKLDLYSNSLAEHDRQATELDLSWIEQLIEAERAGAPAMPRDGAGTSSATPAGAAWPTLSGLRAPAGTADPRSFNTVDNPPVRYKESNR